jgi:hypothetical protein
LPLDARR